MNNQYNIYCDESCHLENDSQKVMILGAIWCLKNKSRDIAIRIREIKQKHNLASDFEIKWTKVSKSKVEFYVDLLDYFFDNDDLHFRAIIVPNKDKLHHELYDQDHDTWYYKMYFYMIKIILDPEANYNIYLDIKDTLGASKINKLREVLSNSLYDFEKRIIRKIQLVHSHEIEQVQLADLLIGAVSYVNRELSGNEGKEKVIKRMRQRSGYNLIKSTLEKENKVNIFRWRPREFDNVQS